MSVQCMAVDCVVVDLMLTLSLLLRVSLVSRVLGVLSVECLPMCSLSASRATKQLSNRYPQADV